jgi:glucosylceramidase
MKHLRSICFAAFAGMLACILIFGCGGGSQGTQNPPPPPTAATPTFSPAAGTFSSVQSVTIADSTTGAAIYYTTDGTTPSSSSTAYSAAIKVSATATIKAIAVASGYNNSAMASATFTINLPAAATPTFSPAAGTYSSAQSVSIADSTTGAAIYYTTDGSTPTTSSTKYSAAVTVSGTTTINAIATADGYSTSAVAAAAYKIGTPGPTVSIVLSTHDEASLMAAQPSASFFSGSAAPTDNVVFVDETQQYQAVEGFGAAFTDSAAYLLKEVVPADQLSSTMSDLFTRDGNGIGLSFMRNPMGASDIARSVYSFDDLATGQTDPTLAKFSIAHDQADVIPIILQAKTLNPQMKLMANPWSPPGWMKDSDNMIGGSLLMTMDAPFADYFVKYIKAYQAAGIPIDYISLQNEPLYVPPAYPGMSMNAGTQLGVLRDFMLPALQNAGLSTQVLVYDHNWDAASYPESVLADPTVQASDLVAGTAWHGYGGTPGAQQILQNLYPTKGNWETEHSGGTWVSDQFSADFIEITHVMRSAGKAYVKWSLALDENLGPNLTVSAGLGGCATCTPIVTVDSKTGAVTKDIEYYTLGHYSKYVLPGAVRIYSSNANGIDDVAFQNPDGSKALIAFNNTAASQSFKVIWGAQSLSYTLPGLAAATFTWSGTQTGQANIPATSQIQGSSYSSETGLETETTSDTTGGYDLGYISNGATAVYPNVDFGSSVATVSVRAASQSGGATATFYLDSPSGTPIATVTLPSTGGWQNWQTASASVTGASGVHDVYVVFTSGANVNWFQFQ